MINISSQALSGKNILLLQGPVGSFFRRFARDLESLGAKVYKVNFNGGDWIFYTNNVINFRDRPQDWSAFFESLAIKLKIDIVVMFGDCRPIHRSAHAIAHRVGLDIWVFEEGYIRPDYITLESFGVNARSLIPQMPSFYLNTKLTEIKTPEKVGSVFWHTAFSAILYYLSSVVLLPWFRNYRHHRPLTLFEILPWVRSFWGKIAYAVYERGMQDRCMSILSGQYFLVPLQVHNDSQICNHSKFDSIEQFIQEVVCSFADHAPKNTHLVIKHHPMDRGYRNYYSLIKQLEQTHNLEGRLHYIHDQHLPTLLKHAKGVVLINSTVGLSALYHGLPLKVCGRANYDISGLTFTGSLADFWHKAPLSIPNPKLFKLFYSYLIRNTQLNGSFYKRLNAHKSYTGVFYNDGHKLLLPVKR
jgi:capsular polysaccharide export protein